jgi:hypothetical protein
MNPTLSYSSRDGALSFTAEFGKLPEATQNKIVASGLNHILGNEVASRFTAWKDAEANVNATDEAKAAARLTIFSDFVKKINEGTLGTRIGGPKADPVETEMDNIARREVLELIAGAGVKIAAKDATDDLPLNLNGVATTLGDLIERKLEKAGDRIRKAAESSVKEKERERAKKAKAKAEAAEKAKSEGGLAALLG